MKHFKSVSFLFLSILFLADVAIAQLQYNAYPRSLENIIEVEKLRDVIFELTSPALEGRELGTPGNIKTTDWLAYTFQRNKLKPIPSLGRYTQSFPIHRLSIDTTFLKFGDVELVLFEDYTISQYSSDANYSELSISESSIQLIDLAQYDDEHTAVQKYSKTDNKILFLYHTSYSNLEFVNYRFEDRIELPLKARKSHKNTSQPFVPKNRTDSPIFHITEKKANYLKELIRASDEKVSFEISLRELQNRTASNVIGYFGSEFDDEYNTPFVLVTTYFDHEGLHPVTGIPYFGAVYNASGVAAMLEMQRILELVENRFEHPVIWVLFNGNSRDQAGRNHFFDSNTLFMDQCIVHIEFDGLAGSPRSSNNPVLFSSSLPEKANKEIEQVVSNYELQLIHNPSDYKPHYDLSINFTGDDFPYQNRVMDSSDKVNLSQLYNQTLYLAEIVWIFSNVYDTKLD